MAETSVSIAPEDLATAVSVLATSQVFLRHRGSLLMEAYQHELSSDKIYLLINRTRDCGPSDFLSYLQKKVALPNGRLAELQFLEAVRNETAPADAVRPILDGIIEKYAPSQPQ